MAETDRIDNSGEASVLDGLDSSAMTSLYWYLALLACIGGFLFGYDTAVIGSVLGFIPYQLSNFWTGYLVAGASLGAAVGALAAGPLTDRLGRKSLLSQGDWMDTATMRNCAAASCAGRSRLAGI